jgi:hypothetical protein
MGRVLWRRVLLRRVIRGSAYSAPPAKVTAALLLRVNAGTQTVSIDDMNTETTNSMLVRASRFFSDRHAYRTQPGYLSELVAFGMIVFVAVWPIILVAHAIAVAPR